MKKIIYLFSLIILAACSQTTEVNKEISDIKITRTTVKSEGVAKTTAKIAVDGMSCAKACGGKIANCLGKLNGVKKTDVFFDPKRSSADYATVEFDDKVITENEMITAIEKIGKGQYKVKSIEIVTTETTYEKMEEPATTKEEKVSAGKVTALNNISIRIPSVFELLVLILR